MSSRFTDDTQLDALAAQVRSLPRLAAADVAALLSAARETPGGPAAARLVEGHLGVVLDAVLARKEPSLDLMDLYQEGSVALTVAIGEYTSRRGSPEGLRRYATRLVDRFLDDVIAREEAQRVADALLIENLKLLEAAEVVLRRRLERDPTTLELAAALNWTPEVVETVGTVLHQARNAYDAEIVDFLDDIED